MNALDRLVKEYYEGACLAEGRVDTILALAPAPARVTPAKVWYARIAAVAATLALASWLGHGYLVERDVTARVLAEIAMNHKKHLSVEVSASDFEAVGRALDRLDFPLRSPARLAPGLELLGGRYCSIQGRLAAQLKLRDQESGAVRTLYAAELTPELAGVPRITAVYEGVEITLWAEDQVFFGYAADVAQGEPPPGRRP